ncbi:MAG: hypothetical protein RMJ29_08755, partial [Candidatus Bipolaricaulota bacterium]|nr:hypothetical protein [Candidatus Bipolaricaulota bacterium]
HPLHPCQSVSHSDSPRIPTDGTDHYGSIRAHPSYPSPSVSHSPSVVTHASATRLPYPDAFFDAVLTDPPYYDNVPYSYLSDFFYVWLK